MSQEIETLADISRAINSCLWCPCGASSSSRPNVNAAKSPLLINFVLFFQCHDQRDNTRRLAAVLLGPGPTLNWRRHCSTCGTRRWPRRRPRASSASPTTPSSCTCGASTERAWSWSSYARTASADHQSRCCRWASAEATGAAAAPTRARRARSARRRRRTRTPAATTAQVARRMPKVAVRHLETDHQCRIPVNWAPWDRWTWSWVFPWVLLADPAVAVPSRTCWVAPTPSSIPLTRKASTRTSPAAFPVSPWVC